MRKHNRDDGPRNPRSRRSNRRSPRARRARAPHPSWLATIRTALFAAAAKAIAKYGPEIVDSPESVLMYRLLVYFLVMAAQLLLRVVWRPAKPPAPARRKRPSRKTLPPARARTAGRSPKRKKPNDTR